MQANQLQATNLNLSDEDWIQLERELCSRSLAEFAKMAWDVLEPATPLKWGWALDIICEHLEAVHRGEIKRLVINVPPASMKSLLTGVIFPAWEWGPKGKTSYRYLGTAHKESLATRDNLKCRRLIQSAWFQNRWAVGLTSDQNAKTKFENEDTGFRESMSFGSMTGSRGDRLILDDPHSVDDANSEKKLETDIRTFRESLPSRTNNKDSAIIIIMQRLHEGDVTAEALKLGYESLVIPMRYEGNKKISTCLDVEDPRTEDGELMFPERFAEDEVHQLETSLGSYATACQLQQTPVPRGGGIFKNAWIKDWNILPDIDFYMIYGDTAQKTKEQNDFSVLELWAKRKKVPNEADKIYLIDMIRGKWEAPELLSQATDFWNKHKGSKNVRKMKIEDKASGTGLIQQLKQKGIPVEGIERNKDKITRGYDSAPQMEAGNVFIFPEHEHRSVLMNELTKFPAATHDDTVDPLMDAIQDLLNTPKFDTEIAIKFVN